MSPDEQKRIVTELCDSLRDTLLSHIDAGGIPEEWDGIELRQLFAEVAWRERTFTFGKMGRFHPTSKRVTEFRSTVLINNLV